MADFIVAMTSDGIYNAASAGQALTPNVPGPNGSGSPGSATEVYLTSFTVAFGDPDTDLRPAVAYIYDVLPTVGQLVDGLYALAASTGYEDGSAFGSGTNTRTYSFDSSILLDPTKLYYVLFPTVLTNMGYSTTSLYSGGKRYGSTLAAQTNSDLQFSAEFDIA